MKRKETIAAIQRRLQNLQENKPEGCEATKAAYKQAVDDINTLLELNSENALEVLEREIGKGNTVKIEYFDSFTYIRVWNRVTGDPQPGAVTNRGLKTAFAVMGERE